MAVIEQDVIGRESRAALTAPPKEVRGLEMPPTTPTQEPVLAPPKKRVGRKIAFSVAAGMTLGTLLAPTVQEYKDNPGRFNLQNLAHDIVSGPASLWDRLFKREAPPVASDKFDPTATKGVITPNNTVSMTAEEYAKSAPKEVGENSVSMPFIIVVPEGFNDSIRYELRKSGAGIKRKITLPSGEKTEIDVSSNALFNNVPVGSRLISAWDGQISQGSFNFRTLSDGSVESLQASIATSDGVKINISTGTIKLEREIPRNKIKEVSGGYDVEVQSTSISRGDVIGTITSGSKIPGSSVDAQVAINVVDRKGVTNIGFATDAGGKIIALQ